MQIPCTSSKCVLSALIFSLWWFLPQPLFTMLVTKWWFSSSTTFSTFTGQHPPLMKGEPSVPPSFLPFSSPSSFLLLFLQLPLHQYSHAEPCFIQWHIIYCHYLFGGWRCPSYSQWGPLQAWPLCPFDRLPWLVWVYFLALTSCSRLILYLPAPVLGSHILLRNPASS